MTDIAKMRDTPLTENEVAKLRMMIARNIAPKVPWYTAPRPPAQFTFKPNAKPVYPKSRLTPKLGQRYLRLLCAGGPFANDYIEMSDGGDDTTLLFTHLGQTGYYLKSDHSATWVPKA